MKKEVKKNLKILRKHIKICVVCKKVTLPVITYTGTRDDHGTDLGMFNCNKCLKCDSFGIVVLKNY